MIEAINGAPTLSAPISALLLRNQADKQVLLQRRSRKAAAPPRRRRRCRSRRRATTRPALRRLGVHAPARGREGRRQSEIGYVHLRAMGGERHRAVGARLLPGLRPRRADHRRAPQQRRQHRQLDPRQAAAQGVVLLAAARRQPDLEHAVRLPRPHGRAGATRAPPRTARRSPRGSGASGSAR